MKAKKVAASINSSHDRINGSICERIPEETKETTTEAKAADGYDLADFKSDKDHPNGQLQL